MTQNDITVIYENDRMLVLLKPVGVASQTARATEFDMVDYATHHRLKKGEDEYVAIINRLDQNVSGPILFAKDRATAAKLSQQMQDGSIKKKYLAVVDISLIDRDLLPHKFEPMSFYLAKDSRYKKAVVLDEEEYRSLDATDSKGDKLKQKSSYKRARMEYKVLEIKNDFALVEINLMTGKFHQIRAGFSHYDMPIVGDYKYGSDHTDDHLMLSSFQISIGNEGRTDVTDFYYVPDYGKFVEFNYISKILEMSRAGKLTLT